MKKLTALLALALCMMLAFGCFASAESDFSIVGDWKIIEFATGDSETDSMMALILSLGEMTFNFDNNGGYTLTMSALGSTDTQKGTYSVVGTFLIMNEGILSMSYSGNTLVLTENSSTYIKLERVGGAAEKPAVPVGQAGSLLGSWKGVSAVCDDEEMQSIYDLFLSYGSIKLYVYDETSMTFTLEALGTAQSVDMTYEKTDDTHLLVVSEDDFTIVEFSIIGDQLTWKNAITGIEFMFVRDN